MCCLFTARAGLEVVQRGPADGRDRLVQGMDRLCIAAGSGTCECGRALRGGQLFAGAALQALSDLPLPPTGVPAADLLSALDFDETGDYLATGDRGGRAVVFERAAVDKARPCSPVAAQRGGKATRTARARLLLSCT